jgi:hypothetical protein
MAKDPWTDPDPQPGDFDAELATIDPRHVEAHAGDPDAALTIVVSVEGEDAKRRNRAKSSPHCYATPTALPHRAWRRHPTRRCRNRVPNRVPNSAEVTRSNVVCPARTRRKLS